MNKKFPGFQDRYLLATPIVISLLNSLIYWPVTLRLIESSKIGELIFFLQVSLFFTPLFVLGMNFTFLMSSSENGKKFRSNEDFAITRYFSVIALISSVIGQQLNYLWLNLLSLIFAQSAGILLLALYRGRRMYWHFAKMGFLILMVAPSIALLNALLFSTEAFILSLSLATSLMVFTATCMHSRFWRMGFREIRSLIQKSIGFTPFLFGGMILLYGHKIFLGLFFSTIDVAHFQIPALIGGGILIAYNLFSPILFDSVLIAGDNRWEVELESVTAKIGRFVIFYPLASFPVIIVTFLLTPPSYPRDLAVAASLILAAVLPIMMCTDIFIHSCVRVNDKRIPALSFVPAVAALIASISWLSFDPIVSIAIATFVGFLVRNIVIGILIASTKLGILDKDLWFKIFFCLSTWGVITLFWLNF